MSPCLWPPTDESGSVLSRYFSTTWGSSVGTTPSTPLVWGVQRRPPSYVSLHRTTVVSRCDIYVCREYSEAVWVVLTLWLMGNIELSFSHCVDLSVTWPRCLCTHVSGAVDDPIDEGVPRQSRRTGSPSRPDTTRADSFKDITDKVSRSRWSCYPTTTTQKKEYEEVYSPLFWLLIEFYFLKI